jgi:hypothetical protein
MACKRAIQLAFVFGAVACAPKCPKQPVAAAGAVPAATLLPDGRVRMADGRELSSAQAAAALPPGAALVFSPPEPSGVPAAAPGAAGEAPVAPPGPAGADAATGSNAPVAPTTPGTAPTAADAAPVAGSLPEVVIENVGLHIGGGPNDDASKAPIKAAVERRFEDLRKCYVHAEEPEKGGTFGVDLFIGRDGGKPELRQPRTGMKGNAFRECVKTAFASVQFEKPPKGPTVVSYSVRFKLR